MTTTPSLRTTTTMLSRLDITELFKIIAQLTRIHNIMDGEANEENQAKLDRLLFLARVAHQADRYDDMTRFLKDVISIHEEMAEDFSPNERYILTVAFKNYIGPFQIGARVVAAIGKT